MHPGQSSTQEAAGTVAFSDPCTTVNCSDLWKDGNTEGLKFNNPVCFETLINCCTVLLPASQLLQWAPITMISRQRAEYKRKEAKEKGENRTSD